MKGKLIDAMSIIAISIITFGATAYAYSNRSTDDYAQKVKKRRRKIRILYYLKILKTMKNAN